MPRKRKNQQGKGPVGDWLKKAVRTVHNFVKEKKLISKGLNLASRLNTPYSTGLTTASNVANSLGYGKRKKIGRKPGRPRKVGRPRGS